MPKQIIFTDQLPAPKGPYSQAVKAGDFFFISGIIGVNPADGSIADDLPGQSTQVLENLKVMLEENGGSLSDIVKTTVFLADIADFPTLNDIYAQYFPTEPPARSTIQALPPAGFLVEIEAIAYIPAN